jgi:hypothetical protein
MARKNWLKTKNGGREIAADGPSSPTSENFLDNLMKFLYFLSTVVMKSNYNTIPRFFSPSFPRLGQASLPPWHSLDFLCW